MTSAFGRTRPARTACPRWLPVKALLATELTHVVYTRDAAGKATIFVNGKEAATAEVAGSLANWVGDFRLLLANERTGDRPWHGELHLVAVYDRALSAGEVAQNFKAGSNWSAVNLAALLPPAADRKVDFVKDVQPILRKHCFECHAEGNEEGGLNLGVKSRALEGGDHGPVFAAGQSAASRLIHLVAGLEKDKLMPPEDNPPLTKDEIGILRAWIDQGAEWPAGTDVLDPRLEQARTHWAFQPLRSVEPPAVKDEGWVRTPIDRFILASLEAKGLAPSPRAESRALLRRLSFDVTGLPPTLALSGLASQEAESTREAEWEKAHEAVVDKLLASRHYGERWGRHWLDVARYADSDGYESDADRPHAYQYRDFVIRALNDDLPVDTFLRWQLAGDEIEPNNPQAVAATGFLTAAAITILPPTHLEEERLRNRYNELDDMLSTIGTGMLGLTLGCARCHDHKYDADLVARILPAAGLAARRRPASRQAAGKRQRGAGVSGPGRRAAGHVALQPRRLLRPRPAGAARLSGRAHARADDGRLLDGGPPRSAARGHDVSAKGAGRVGDRRRARGRGAGRARDRQPRLAAPFRRRAGPHRQRFRRPQRSSRRIRSCSNGWPTTSWRMAGSSSGCTG